MNSDLNSDDPLAMTIAALMKASQQQSAPVPAHKIPTLDELMAGQGAGYLPDRYRPIVWRILTNGTPDVLGPLLDQLSVRGDGRTPFVVIVGPTGSGKTTLALMMPIALALRSGVTRLERPMFVHADEVCSARRFAKLGDEPDVLYRARTKRLVIIDDVIGQKDEAGDLYRVIRHREEQGMPTIITAGFNRNEAASAYGEQFARRMFAGAVHLIGGKR
jgi:hypothetical protein